MQKTTDEQFAERMPPASHGRRRLPRLAWLIWALVIFGTGYASWQLDYSAGRPFNPLGIAIHCILATMVGLLLLTWLEVRLTRGLDC